MARRDVIKEFLSIQEQYFEMCDTAKDYDEALKGKYISQDQYEYAQELIKELKINYDRWAFIIHLLNEPVKKDKKIKYSKQNVKLEDYLEHFRATGEDTLDEGQDCLKRFKDYINEIKNNKELDYKQFNDLKIKQLADLLHLSYEDAEKFYDAGMRSIVDTYGDEE